MTLTLLIDLFSEQRFFISNLCTFFGTPGICVCNQVVEGCISCKSTFSLADYGSETMVGLASILYIKCGKCSVSTPLRTSQSHMHEPEEERRIFDINTKCAAANNTYFCFIFNQTPFSP